MVLRLEYVPSQRVNGVAQQQDELVAEIAE
jgi:hypothetical protein